MNDAVVNSMNVSLENGSFVYNYGLFESQHRVIDLHFHNEYELFMLLNGKAVYTVEGNVYEIEPYDLIITNTREIHRPLYNVGESYERIFISFKPQFLSFAISDEFNPFCVFEKRKPGRFNKINASEIKKLAIDTLLGDIKKTLTEKKPEASLNVKICLALILIKISNAAEFYDDKFQSNERVSKIIKFISKNIDSDLTYAIICNEFFISKNHLYNLFKAQTGCTVGEYVEFKRIVLAKELLVSGMAMTEVAYAVGFNEYSTFYRVFKRLTGSSPREFVTYYKEN